MLISRRRALALALTVLAALPGASAPAVDDEPTTSESMGLALLEKAARHQSETAWPRAPRTLHGSFYGTIQTQKGSGNVTVERWYTRSPERIVTRHTESVTGSRHTIGHDGRTAWFRNDATGEVVHYSDDPERFSVDLELLEEQRRLTRLLMDAVVLDALIPRLREVRLSRAGKHVDIERRPRTVRYVTALTLDDLYPPAADAPPPSPDDPPPTLRLNFGIDEASGTLWSLQVRPLGRDDVAGLELHFDYHERTAQGLLVPGNVRVFAIGADTEAIRLGVSFDDDDELAFDLDVEVDPKVFSPPARGS